MAKYIKSHSNYVLKNKHQMVKNGSIIERDAVTIGGLNQFAKGQRPIYQSSNFLITINNENEVSRDILTNKWESGENGEYWTLDDIKVNSAETESTLDIKLKEDIYNLRDFAYYGSCMELIRSSINNIIRNFPGEMHAPIVFDDGVTVYYEDTTESVTNPSSKYLIDGDYKYLLDNPFSINIYDDNLDESKISNKLRYFGNNGWENYQIYSKNSKIGQDITSWRIVSKNESCVKKGGVVYHIELSYGLSKTLPISVLIGDGRKLVYLVKQSDLGVSIRPKETLINNFFKGLDTFETVLLNRNTKPLYKAKFEVLSENSFGLETELKEFIFPRTYGEYNLAIDNVAYNSYLDSLIEIGNFYDENFSDNLYRSMTHEPIKNFDWAYSRDYSDETDEYKISGTKIQKLIRIFGREFDEIKKYISGIKNYNTINYNDINSLPNYFLTDAVEMEGWDIRNVYPLKMSEKIGNFDCKESLDANLESRIFNIFNNSAITRTFDENLNLIIKPYSSNKKYYSLNKMLDVNIYNGYFISATTFNEDSISITLKNPLDESRQSYFNGYTVNGKKTVFTKKIEEKPYFKPISVDENNAERYFSDKCYIRTKIKAFTSEKEYSMNDVNNHFMKMLKMNSRDINLKKGTIGGVESVLGLFGLKSKKWFDSLNYLQKRRVSATTNGKCYDYEISEVSCFTNGIIDRFIDSKNMYQIDWYNYTKSYSYDTEDFRGGVYNAYQGLPVKYYDASGETETNSLRYGNDRILYPYFDKDAILDGNLYYQMYGGWMNKLPYTINKDNEIVSATTNYQLPVFQETIRPFGYVDKVEDLISLPYDKLNDGDIYKVGDLVGEYAIVNGEVLNVYTENYNGLAYKYFIATINENVVTIGGTQFGKNISISNPYNLKESCETTINLDNFIDGDEIKIYILPYQGNVCLLNETNKMVDYSDKTINFGIKLYDDYTTVSNFSYFRDKTQNPALPTTANTNYFRLASVEFKNEISQNGWQQITIYDYDYKRIMNIIDYFKGNNPHYSRKPYDFGDEYIKHFSRLFKNAYDEEAFDVRCYDDGKFVYYEYMNDIYNVGFHTLDKNWTGLACGSNYLSDGNTITNDSKIHYFGDLYVKKDGTNTIEHEKTKISKMKEYSGCSNNFYMDYTSITKTEDETHDDGWEFYSGITNNPDQIVNTKVVNIKFKLNGNDNPLKSNMIEEIKYLDSVVMNYVSQVIPSNAIVKINYGE